MPLTLDPTPGGASANSYVSLADAETYFAARVHADAWTGATVDQKPQALAAATARLDQERYAGVKAAAAQRLKWPRAYVSDADPARDASTVDVAIVGGAANGVEVFAYLPTTTIPRWLADATCEVALQLLQQGTTDPAAPTGLEAFKELKVGTLDLVPREDGPLAARSPLPAPALRLLRPYFAGTAGVVRLERA